MIEAGNGKTVVNCPGCGMEYNMDEYKRLKKAEPNNGIHDPRVCFKCGTEFGYVNIVGKDGNNTIFQIDLDLEENRVK